MVKKIKSGKPFIKIGNYFPRPLGNFHRQEDHPSKCPKNTLKEKNWWFFIYEKPTDTTLGFF